ncbi:MAG TPA: hypothetical protein VGL72_19705 [Bryobacteraceae bacterium]|jgi:hypothetical protein
MDAEGPILEALTHRLSECPEEFLLAPGVISVPAVAHDHLRAMGVPVPDILRDARDLRFLSLVAVASWLLHDDWFLARPELAAKMQRLLGAFLQPLSAVVPAKDFVRDPDRREELARFCLAQLGFRPQGESIAQAKDRLTSLDSLERIRVLRDTQEAEARAQEVRRMMAKRAAEEAAAKATRE